jgi:phosphonate transport system substrate-binding protein
MRQSNPMKFLRKSRHKRSRLAAIALATTTLALALGARATKAETLVIGTVGKDIKAEMKEHESLAKYLQERLSSSGVDKVEVAILPSAAKMSDALKQGTVHLYFESPLVAAKLARDGHAVPMLRRWRKGLAEYRAEIIVLVESPIQSLEDLRGRVIAFDDPDSTTGHLLPRAMLVARGLKLEFLNRAVDPVDSPKVGAVFTMSDKAAILSLFEGRVAAAATDPLYIKKIEEERPGSVRSIAHSITVPRHVVMRSATLPEHQAERIAAILRAMHESQEGRNVLEAAKTARFDAFPDGIEGTFAPLFAQLRILDAADAPVPGTQ